MKNLKKSTGTMNKKDVYYKVDDLKTKEVTWSKISALVGTLDPAVKKEIKTLTETAKDKKPTLKLGRVKRTLVLRLKDGSKHVGEWVLLDEFVPPDDLTGKDKEYALKFAAYIDARKDLLKRMKSLHEKAEKAGEVGRYHSNALDEKYEQLEKLVSAGQTEDAQKLALEMKTQLADIQQISRGLTAVAERSVTFMAEQRTWKAGTLKLDNSDYNSRMDEWWSVVGMGQSIDSISREIASAAKELTKLVADAEKVAAGAELNQEEALEELNTLLADMTKLRKDTDLHSEHIEKHLERFRALAKELPAIEDEEERQELFDNEVPKRINNAEGYFERLKSGFARAKAAAKRIKLLGKRGLGGGAKGVIDLISAQISGVVANYRSGEDNLKNTRNLGKDLEETLG